MVDNTETLNTDDYNDATGLHREYAYHRADLMTLFSRPVPSCEFHFIFLYI